MTVTNVKKGGVYKDGGSYDVIGKLNGKPFRFFRYASSIDGDGNLYTNSKMTERVPEHIAELINKFNI